ncbi:MAG: polysaccharide biosynthesis/export family protein [Candidatus Symbiothrix sp.]|nr:polysaccharide biosynthesis/export family protein [Candidatus Symbiothrix sp.]
MKEDRAYPVMEQQEIKIQQNDKLSITVSAKNPELAEPFNVGTGGTYRVGDNSNISESSASVIKEKGYVVNENGDINFPVLGRIHAEGLTKLELGEFIRKRLIEEGQLKEPFVSVELLNLKIMMMGETSVGILSVDESRITLLEALTRAGGIKDNGRMDKVGVIREEDGVRRLMITDVRSTAVFDSPCFYLQQNDIVYVYPKATEVSRRFQSNWSMISILTSMSTLVLYALLLNKN